MPPSLAFYIYYREQRAKRLLAAGSLIVSQVIYRSRLLFYL